MSAFVQSKEHVDAIIRTGLEGPSGRAVHPDNAWHTVRWYVTEPRAYVAGMTDYAESSRRLDEIRRELTHETADRVGAMLIAENVRSVQHRYPDAGMDSIPGPVDNGYATDALLGQYRYRAHAAAGSPGAWGSMVGPRRLTAVEALKAIDGYEYQACEHDGWEASEAKAFCEALRRALIGALPGYDAADTWGI